MCINAKKSMHLNVHACLHALFPKVQGQHAILAKTLKYLQIKLKLLKHIMAKQLRPMYGGAASLTLRGVSVQKPPFVGALLLVLHKFLRGSLPSK